MNIKEMIGIAGQIVSIFCACIEAWFFHDLYHVGMFSLFTWLLVIHGCFLCLRSREMLRLHRAQANTPALNAIWWCNVVITCLWIVLILGLLSHIEHIQ